MGVRVPFDVACVLAGLPAPEPEHTFCEGRKWALDWSWPAFKVALEIEGGLFLKGGGRHNRGAGMIEDMKKYNEASILGWLIVRVTPDMVRDGEALTYAERALGARGWSSEAD